MAGAKKVVDRTVCEQCRTYSPDTTEKATRIITITDLEGVQLERVQFCTGCAEEVSDLLP